MEAKSDDSTVKVQSENLTISRPEPILEPIISEPVPEPEPQTVKKQSQKPNKEPIPDPTKVVPPTKIVTDKSQDDLNEEARQKREQMRLEIEERQN